MRHSPYIELILYVFILNDSKLYLPLRIEGKRRQILGESMAILINNTFQIKIID